MVSFLKLIRYKNLLMVLLTMVLTKYAIINSFTSTISDFQFILLLISVLLITASGYVINDVFDVQADKINKPTKVYIDVTISKKNALIFYKITTLIGLTLGVYTAYLKGNLSYSIFFIVSIVLLYWYSKKLKRVAVIGNLVTSFLVALTLFIVYVFEIKNTTTASNLFEEIANFFATISVTIYVFIYIIFAFFMTLIREIIKDIEDIKGDYTLKMKTLPILIGINRTKKIVLILSSLVYLFIIFVLKEELLHIPLLLWYTLLFIVIPFTWFLFKLNASKTKKHFHTQSNLIKVIMFFGILSMSLIKF
jgi:4-hydroxybenzoate polyprenyltransferase